MSGMANFLVNSGEGKFSELVQEERAKVSASLMNGTRFAWFLILLLLGCLKHVAVRVRNPAPVGVDMKSTFEGFFKLATLSVANGSQNTVLSILFRVYYSFWNAIRLVWYQVLTDRYRNRYFYNYSRLLEKSLLQLVQWCLEQLFVIGEPSKYGLVIVRLLKMDFPFLKSVGRM